jgi:hypothetical protein
MSSRVLVLRSTQGLNLAIGLIAPGPLGFAVAGRARRPFATRAVWVLGLRGQCSFPNGAKVFASDLSAARIGGAHWGQNRAKPWGIQGFQMPGLGSVRWPDVCLIRYHPDAARPGMVAENGGLQETGVKDGIRPIDSGNRPRRAEKIGLTKGKKSGKMPGSDL